MNPGDAMILDACFRCVEQANEARFKGDDGDEIGSESMVSLMRKVVEDPTLLERPDDFELVRKSITKARIWSWRRSDRRATKRASVLKRLFEANRPAWSFANWRVEVNMRSERLESALSQLTREQQEAVFLRHALDWPPREIATRLKIPVGTVKGRVHRAIVRLREIMSDGTTDSRETSP